MSNNYRLYNRAGAEWKLHTKLHTWLNCALGIFLCVLATLGLKYVACVLGSSLCIRQAECCCHAGTQPRSIILRPIKRRGYPERRESCLSFHSLLFLPVSSHQHLVLPDSSPCRPPLPSLTPNPIFLSLSASSSMKIPEEILAGSVAFSHWSSRVKYPGFLFF